LVLIDFAGNEGFGLILKVRDSLDGLDIL